MTKGNEMNKSSKDKMRSFENVFSGILNLEERLLVVSLVGWLADVLLLLARTLVSFKDLPLWNLSLQLPAHTLLERDGHREKTQ